MVIRRSLVAVLALLTALGAATAGAQRPHHGDTPVRAGGTPDASDCSLLVPYMDGLDAALEEGGPFLEFLFSDQEYQELSDRRAREIVADGDRLLVEMDELDVPGPYQPGHDGIVLYLQTIIDFTRFYVLDSSQVPDIVAYDDAMTGIYTGEVAIAEACPDELDDAGGFIFLRPSTLEDEYGPEGSTGGPPRHVLTYPPVEEGHV